MKIQLVRNACMVIHTKEHRILVDPCLNPKGSLPPFTFFRKKPKLNPLVNLPSEWEFVSNTITLALVTHCRLGHWDHLDKTGIAFLVKNNIPVYCSQIDEKFLKNKGLYTIPLKVLKKNPFLNGTIRSYLTQHGYGLVSKLMGPGAGYFIELPDEPTLYISGDTVFTPIVNKVLEKFKPDISVLNAGTATLDIGQPILMTIDEQLEFINAAPGKVIAVHLDTFNHCLTDRQKLRETIEKQGLVDKVIIPKDGELLEF